MRPQIRVVLAGAGVLAGLGGAAALAWGGYPAPSGTLALAVVLTLAVGWSFLFVGLAGAGARPDSRIGVLMVIAGFAALARPLGAIDATAPFLLGMAIGNLVYGLVAHLLVSFPTGRLHTRGQRTAVGVIYFLTGPFDVIVFLLDTGGLPCSTCRYDLVLPRVPAEPELSERLFQTIIIAGSLAILALLHRRWQRASPALQRSLAPPLLGGALLLLVLIAQRIGIIVAAPPGVRSAFSWASYVALAFLPLGLLAGLVRGRLDRTAVADLAVALTGPAGHQGLRAALARAVHDPSLDVVYWIAEQQEFLDGDGTAVRLDGRPPSATTVLQRDGQPVAALLHDEVVGEQRALLEAVAATAGLAIENERLHAEVRAQLAEVRASRARIVAAAAAERRRVERNLHDGAQQSLLSVLLALRLVRAQLDAGSSDAARASLDDACTALTAALDEVRELARGIHPAVLSDAGLADALRALAERSPVPVELSAVPPGRLPSLVEETAYYVVAESLANVVKHARATRAVVDLRLRQGRLLVQVRDDGAGGAEPARGSGLRGLVDRVAAVDGHLDVDSTSSGTRVQAEIPCG